MTWWGVVLFIVGMALAVTFTACFAVFAIDEWRNYKKSKAKDELELMERRIQLDRMLEQVNKRNK